MLALIWCRTDTLNFWAWRWYLSTKPGNIFVVRLEMIINVYQPMRFSHSDTMQEHNTGASAFPIKKGKKWQRSYVSPCFFNKWLCNELKGNSDDDDNLAITGMSQRYTKSQFGKPVEVQTNANCYVYVNDWVSMEQNMLHVCPYLHE